MARKKDSILGSAVVIGLAIFAVVYFWSFSYGEPMLSPESAGKLSLKTIFFGVGAMAIMFVMGLLVSLLRKHIDKKLKGNAVRKRRKKK